MKLHALKAFTGTQVFFLIVFESLNILHSQSMSLLIMGNH